MSYGMASLGRRPGRAEAKRRAQHSAQQTGIALAWPNSPLCDPALDPRQKASNPDHLGTGAVPGQHRLRARPAGPVLVAGGSGGGHGACRRSVGVVGGHGHAHGGRRRPYGTRGVRRQHRRRRRTRDRRGDARQWGAGGGGGGRRRGLARIPDVCVLSPELEAFLEGKH